MNQEIDFEKYKKRGAYHWQNYFGSVTQIDSFLRGRYDLVINLLDKYKANKDSSILEVGCGDGALTGLIYKKFQCKLNGIDPSEDGIRFCREMFDKNGYKGSFSTSLGYTFDFADNSFDMVVLADVIEHLQHPNKMLAEIKRVLRPSGKVIITTPVRSTEYPEDKMHVHEFYPDELVSLCSQFFGEPIERIYSHPVVWHELYTFGKKRNRSLIRLYCRLSDKVFGKNVFLQKDSTRWKNFKQQGLLLEKK